MEREWNVAPLADLCELRPPDEHANLITHAAGFALSLVGAVYLMRIALAGHPLLVIAACGVYCASLVTLYLASTLSHAFRDPQWRRFFRMVDQSSIYVLIAGSFTPFAVVHLWHDNWPVLLIVMWTFAIVGVLVTVRFGNLPTRARWSYGVMGWLPVISLPNVIDAASPVVLLWILAGGLFYSVGTIFLHYGRRIRYCHAAWHTFVMAGSASHYLAILLLLEGR